MQTKQYFRVNLDAKSLHMYTKTDTFLNLFLKNLSVLLSKKKKKDSFTAICHVSSISLLSSRHQYYLPNTESKYLFC